MTARRVHYFSDCPFFAGCENMLANFLTSEELADRFDVAFSYNHSPEYETGLRRRVPNPSGAYPLRLYCVGRLAGRFRCRPVRIAFRALAFATLLRYWFIALNTYKLWRFLGKIGPVDVLHVNNGGFPAAYSTYSVVFAARLRGISNIVYVVNNLATAYSVMRWLDWPFDRLVGCCTTKFITGSQFAGSRLKDVLHLPGRKLKCIPNGINLRKVTESPAEVRERLGVSPRRFILGIVAVLEHRKGHIYAIKAMAAIKEAQGVEDTPVLLIEGHGSEQDELERYVRLNNLEETVRFIGDEAHVVNFMNALDVVLLPSIGEEDFPNVVIEAMGLGKVVIASRLCGTPEQIYSGIDGVLVEPKDVLGLAAEIVRMSSDSDYRAALGRRAGEKFAEMFTADVAIGRYIDLYEGMLRS